MHACVRTCMHAYIHDYQDGVGKKRSHISDDLFQTQTQTSTHPYISDDLFQTQTQTSTHLYISDDLFEI